MNIFGYQIDLIIAGFVIALIGALIALFAWILPRKARLRRDEEERIRRIEEEPKLLNKKPKKSKRKRKKPTKT